MKIIYVRPVQKFKLLGTALEVVPEQIYPAVVAKNLPDWEERGAIYVGGEYGIILEKGEYTRIKGYKPPVIEGDD